MTLHVKNSFVHSSAVIVGEVRIGRSVFIAPNAVLRADEPDSKIYISDNCNVQDNVVVHALRGSAVLVEESASLSHGCVVHGPCKIGKRCFVGFRAVVFDAELGKGSAVMHGAIVTGIEIPSNTLVPAGSVIDSQEKVKELSKVPHRVKRFTASVLHANKLLLKKYLSQK